MSQRIVDFYSRVSTNPEKEVGRRWSRLRAAPPWIYIDVHAIFTDWDGTWKAGRESLTEQAKVAPAFPVSGNGFSANDAFPGALQP